MPNEEIIALKDRLVAQLSPLKVYLFGSYAYGTPNEDSDYDFYIIVGDDRVNTHDEAVRAYRAIGLAKTRPVDILVGTNSQFERRRQWYSTIEQEVFGKGVLLYDANQSAGHGGIYSLNKLII